MAGPRYIMLEDRGIVTIGGEDRRTFLQGLISNDVGHVDGARSVYAAFLTAQGKYLHDFFVAEIGDVLALDCERQRSADLVRRLRIYRLRAKVGVEDRSADWAVAALIGEEVANAVGLAPEPGATAPFLGGVAFVDPRLADAGVRAILPRRRRREVPRRGRVRRREPRGLRPPPPGAGARRRQPRHGAGADHPARVRLRRAPRGGLGEGLLPRPGADRADQVPGADQEAADPGAGRGAAAGAGHADPPRRPRGRRDALRPGRSGFGDAAAGSAWRTVRPAAHRLPPARRG